MNAIDRRIEFDPFVDMVAANMARLSIKFDPDAISDVTIKEVNDVQRGHNTTNLSPLFYPVFK